MKFLKLKRFSRDEDGAVTVDWVVLTAAVVGLAIAAFGSIKESSDTLTEKIAGDISGQASTTTP